MYQYQIEVMEKRIKNLKRLNGNLFFLILLGLIVLAATIEADRVALVSTLLLFIIGAGKRYFVDPLITKLELIESDIDKIKQAINLPEEKRY